MPLSMRTKFVSAAENGSMNYAVYYPDDYADLPLLVYLHGAGERGTEFDHLYRHGIPLLLQQGRTFPAVILIPGKSGSLGLAARALQSAIERAVGADIT